MNTFKNICFVAIMVFAFTSCKNETQPEVKTIEVEVTNKDVASKLDPNATYAKVEFGIDGMTCAMGCAKTIEKKMAKMEGVKSAKVDFDKRLAMVEYDEAKVTPTSLEEVVKKAGDMYSVTDMHTVSSSQDKLCKMACCEGKTDEEKANCKMACCADKADASDNVDGEKMACAKDCKKACCADKAEATKEKKMACAADCKKACCADKAKA